MTPQGEFLDTSIRCQFEMRGGKDEYKTYHCGYNRKAFNDEDSSKWLERVELDKKDWDFFGAKIWKMPGWEFGFGQGKEVVVRVLCDTDSAKPQCSLMP